MLTSDAYAGLERHVVALVRELRRLGCKAAIACPPSASTVRREAAALGIPVLPGAHARGSLWLGSVARSVRRHPPDVLHFHDGRSALAGAVLAPLAGSTTVRTQHFTRPASVERNGWFGSLSRQLQRSLNRGLSGYIGVSDAVVRGAIARNEVRSAELVVIPPGIDLPDAAEVAAARAWRTTSHETPTIGYLGRLEPEKCLEVLVEAVPLVLEACPGARFVIAGAGSAERQLKDLAATFGVSEAVDWPGWIPGPASVLARIHVYANTWPWEGYGMAMAEAMAYGIPVVAPDSGASPELVSHEETGLLFATGQPQSLAAALIRLVSERQTAERLGQRAHDRADAEFGAAAVAERVLGCYRDLVAERAP